MFIDSELRNELRDQTRPQTRHYLWDCCSNQDNSCFGSVVY